MKKLYMLLVVVLIMVITGCSSSTDPHTVTYDANGGTGSVPTDSNTYLPTFTVTVLENIDLTNAGYTFTCWNTQADGNGTDRAPAATFAIGSANVILYAKWTADPTYTVTYDANGGTGGIPSDSNNYLVGAEVTVKSNDTLTKAGYTFTCWNTQADGNGTDRAPALKFAIGSANVILYAKWTALSSAKAITAFTFPISTGTTITEAAHTIAVTVPDGTNVTALVPTITHTGASISPDTGVAHDFTSAAKYTVTAADASIQAYTVTLKYGYLSTNIGILKYVPPGAFQRDATSTNISTISTAFRMSQYEITRAQFLAVMGTDPSDITCSTGTSNPVQMINWYHAIAFCNKLSIAEGLTPVYSVSGINFTTLTYADIPTTTNTTWDLATANWSANGYRLPTEMEWMWAAMGATSGYGYTSGTYTTGYAKAFAGSTGSNAIGDYAWTSENSTSTTHPVGTKLPNELGLYDMSGNAWEWCWDWYATPYTTGTLTDDKGAVSGTYRVLRGGSWLHDASIATVAYRNNFHPYYQYNNYGFRVVRP